MQLTRIEYTGRKVYKDKYSRNTWNPGDIMLVSPEAAKKLLNFAEFKEASTAKAKATEKKPEPTTTQTDDSKKPSTGLSVAELQAALTSKGIVIPEGVTKKADLAALLDNAKDESELSDEELQARIKIREEQERVDAKKRELDNILMEVDAMPKAALVDYAAKYDRKLDSSKKVADMRAEVVELVHELGPR